MRNRHSAIPRKPSKTKFFRFFILSDRCPQSMKAGMLDRDEAAAIIPIWPTDAPRSLANSGIKREVAPLAMPFGR